MTNDFINLAAPGVRELIPYQPGKPISELEREYGISNSIKLASNENPQGPSPAALKAMDEAARDINLYPDGNGYYLKQKLAEKHGVPIESITLGNGSNEIIMLAAETFLTPDDEAVFSQYSFAAYPIAVQAVGAVARVIPALGFDSDMPLGNDLDGFREAIGPKTKLVFIANPNNPTGTWIEGDVLREFVAGLPSHVIAVVDEAYFEYDQGKHCGDASAWVGDMPNLLVARSFSKAYGLAGLRIGYGLSHPDVAGLMNRVRLAFNTNILAQAAAIASLDATDYIERSRQINEDGLIRLKAFCDAQGIRYAPSRGNFLLMDMNRDAGDIYLGLLKEGIIVRPVAGYGLPNWLRVSIGLPNEMDRFIQTLPRVMALLK